MTHPHDRITESELRLRQRGSDDAEDREAERLATEDAACRHGLQDGATAPRVTEIPTTAVTINLCYRDAGNWIDANDPIDDVVVNGDLSDDEVTAAIVEELERCGEYEDGPYLVEWACGSRSGWAVFGGEVR